ncbi:porin [Luteimonas sp. M1R5S18]|jgi:phosphate-selective porin OprO/OprP|uniref:Porin n=1 Tax=Luteimonas rhizosphaericola TaxID=3042024 RepID=A0ABT6JJH5_9GAMM|nr:porin [Luteimonas rhizosphaericola]MDH5830682.1 porin [Luteimonas rhizosphaericola]
MRHSLLATVVVSTLAVVSAPAAAQSPQAQEIAELKAQIAALAARVQELETRTDDASAAPAAAVAQTTSPQPVVATKGGLKVTSADKAFEVSLGGRIHFDAYAFDRDQAEPAGTTEFRRARLTLQGKAYGWDYKLEQDFAAGSNLDGLRDAYIAREALGGRFTIGHFKPYRSMEELTSSNDLLMMERPFASATGLFNGRQFQQGVGYLRAGDNYTAGFSAFNLRGASGARNEGVGYAGRVTFAPIATDQATLHFGAWASQENANQGSADLVASVNYAGRRGPSQAIATVSGASGDEVTAYGVEAAGAFGPLFFQGEYANAAFGQPLGPDQDVTTWYLQGSWHLNGGHKPYKAGTGVFGSAPVAGAGLWELTARYDAIENRDIADLDVSSWLLGVNYYVNPALRFMFNYTRGDNGFNGDETGQYALRTQFAF